MGWGSKFKKKFKKSTSKVAKKVSSGTRRATQKATYVPRVAAKSTRRVVKRAPAKIIDPFKKATTKAVAPIKDTAVNFANAGKASAGMVAGLGTSVKNVGQNVGNLASKVIKAPFTAAETLFEGAKSTMDMGKKLMIGVVIIVFIGGALLIKRAM